MNKKTFTSILQVALFSFDGATEKQILELNDYDLRIIKAGRSLCNYLKNLEVLN